MNLLRWLERVAWIAGLALLAIYAGARASSERARLEGITAIEGARAELSSEPTQAVRSPEAPDISLWAPSRIEAWRVASNVREEPQAVLSIASVDLSVPVFEGTSENHLNRGAGRIQGTAQIGEQGNVGLAAHRDGYFRALKDVRIGDHLQLTTKREEFTYRVTDISVVEPTAVEVLAPTSTPSLTLVTCYPFYFLGSAPQRFIVRAELLGYRH
jgi:sortase A